MKIKAVEVLTWPVLSLAAANTIHAAACFTERFNEQCFNVISPDKDGAL